MSAGTSSLNAASPGAIAGARRRVAALYLLVRRARPSKTKNNPTRITRAIARATIPPVPIASMSPPSSIPYPVMAGVLLGIMESMSMSPKFAAFMTAATLVPTPSFE